MMKLLTTAAVLVACATTASAQVDQRRIDQAIKKGIEWLKTAPSPGHDHSKAEHSDELILLTMIHADVSESNPRFKELLARVLQDPPYQTYKVALQAMCLEEIDRVKYQPRIAQCAQHLVDNMCTNGQWSYGTPTEYKAIPPQPPDVASGPAPKKPGAIDFGAAKVKPKVIRKIPIKAQRDGGGSGDNSNSQYAALGLRACFDAGITFEEGVILRAMKWWIDSQGAPEDGAAANAVVSGGDARPRGWNYSMPGADGAYGSMTAGAVGSVVIYDYMMKKDWKKNPVANAGVAWLAAKWEVTANPNKGGAWHYYYLYGLERAGILYDTTLIGKHDWYMEGAKVLLDAQDGNGSWQNQTWESCFAILFLKKATRPLVATGGGK